MDSRLLLALETLNSEPVSRQRLVECFEAVWNLPDDLATEEFAQIASASKALWDAAWLHRVEVSTPADVQLAARAALEFAKRCDKL